jgi:hypothetical protein
MMNRFPSALALVGLFAVPAAAQVHINGYFSADYVQGQRQSSFSLGSFQGAQAGLVLSGEWAPRFAYALEIRSRDVAKFEIEQAWLSFLWSEAVHVKVGLYLVPFGKYNESARPFQTRLVQPPLPVDDVFPSSWRDIGVLIEGKSEFLVYSAYLGNGLAEAGDLRSGQQFMDNNRDKGRGGRIGLLLSQALEAGVSYYSGKIDAENKRGLTLKGVDVTWSDARLHLTGEYVRAEIENPAPFAKGTAEGWFALGSFDIGSLSPFVAYQKIDYADPFHGAGFAGPLTAGMGVFDKRSLWALGLVATLHPNVLLKFEYDLNKESGLEVKNNVLRAQAAVHF